MSGKEFLPLLGYLAVHRHHGHLKAPEEILPPLGAPDKATGELWHALRVLERQFDALRNFSNWLCEWQELNLEDVIAFVEEPELPSLFEELDRLLYQLNKLDEEERARLCLWGQLLFSALIDADKRSAAGLPPLPPRPNLPGDLVERYVAYRYVQPRHELDRERAAFFHMVTEQARRASLPLNEPLALTAPTGMGKTLAALSTAFVLRERLAEHYGVAPRIVYALPFINLIEQNYDVVHDLLAWGLPNFAANEQLYLLKHHHLTDIAYLVEDENRPVVEALLLTEGWESEIVVTTFVQVFHTLLGYQNRLLRKLHNLIGGILILDELQNLKMEYWPAVSRVFDVLREEIGLTVIQITATRPLVFPQVRELYPDPPHLFGLMRRTMLDVNLTERSIEDLADEVGNLAEEHDTVLVVVNTVGDCIRLYQALKARGIGTPILAWQEGEPFPLAPNERALVYLSTNIVPLHRAARLAFLREWLKEGEQAVLVATQVVEAGVDLDFAVAVRDLGPLDAIVQVAGRCNREGRRKQGLVLVRRLQGSCPSQVYGVVHIHTARALLEGITRLEEPEFVGLVERYFVETRRRKSQETSDRLWQAYLGLQYDGKSCGNALCLSNFHLIEEMPSVPIFVALCGEDENWLRNFFTPRVLEEKDWKRRQEAYLRYRRYLHERMLQVPEFRAEKNPPPLWGPSRTLRWVPSDQLNEYYDLETGFRWATEDLDRAWIV
jgi:CRISPR-associated endonuclease/helicase Cas3